MQEVNVKNFTARLEDLQKRWACNDIELCKRLGISRQLLYLMRSKQHPPSKKTLLLLEQAESSIEQANLQSTGTTLETGRVIKEEKTQYPNRTIEERMDALEKKLDDILKLLLKGRR
jgi:transcriptional regulator with XRE-family HTH domain